MGLGNLKKKLDLLLALNSAEGEIEKGARMGKLQPVLFGLAGAIVTGVVGAFTSACPALSTQSKAMALAAVATAVTTYMLKPAESAGFKATMTGLGTAVVAGFVMKLNAVCPDFVSQLPQLATVGATAGIGLYLKSHRQA